MPKKLNIKGKKYGDLTVLEPTKKDNRTAWLCLCSCGNKKVVLTSNLTTQKTKSCGMCKHLLHKKYPRTYRVWSSMKSRCNNKNHQFYQDYGGRGISVCSRWGEFKNFLEDMGTAPEGLSIERINNNKNYEPENCKWATWKEQHNNKRNNRFLTYKGKTQTMAEWARELKINYRTLKSRLNIQKLSVSEALSK